MTSIYGPLTYIEQIVFTTMRNRGYRPTQDDARGVARRAGLSGDNWRDVPNPVDRLESALAEYEVFWAQTPPLR